ncbi:hypothetical protein MMC2321_01955 [Chitinophaga sp. MM2321]
MSVYTNVITEKIDLIVQRQDNRGWAFRWRFSDGTYIDWSLYPGIRMDVKSGNRIVLSHKIDDGLIVHSDPTYLKLRPWGNDNEKDLPSSDEGYGYDLKVPFTETIIRYPFRGLIKVVDYITK